MQDRTGWERGESGKQKIGRKTYKNLTRFSRLCVTCGQPFSIFVTQKIADGLADSNNFGLRNCDLHRRAPVSMAIEDARSKENTMKDEINELYATQRTLVAEIENLRTRLSKYELPEALKQAAAPAKMPWQL